MEKTIPNLLKSKSLSPEQVVVREGFITSQACDSQCECE